MLYCDFLLKDFIEAASVVNPRNPPPPIRCVAVLMFWKLPGPDQTQQMTRNQGHDRSQWVRTGKGACKLLWCCLKSAVHPFSLKCITDPLLSSTCTPTEVNLDGSSGSGISSGPSTYRKKIWEQYIPDMYD